ncbi:TIM-barrel enzyme [Porphyromonadaceae bacterium COT-184 OH4590]|nr:TIM-barrel enzyme [Porphyromonadaceae bacterium COT-184 OH4590]MDO4727348.1 tRNA dihydrouridine synthase DusB [Porphyromonadaceae bacterium]
MKIGEIQFDKYPVFLAPMEDVTDLAFRLICKEFGADLVYTEFINADALVRFVNRTMQKLTILPNERPVAIQIYGKDPQTMVEAARIVAGNRPDIIDINFGCPVKKIANKGAGAGLLRDIPRMLEITSAVVKAVNIPVTVKTRLGWDDNSKIITTLAEQLQDCGIAALAVHGRTRAQMYTGEADWSLIGEVKNNQRIKIPIIGNGDIVSAEGAKDKFDKYGVDAIMVGRGAIGNAWVFAEIKNYLLGEDKYNIPDFEGKKKMLKQHIVNSIEWLEDERKGIIHSRRHIAATPIFKGIPNFKPTRIAMLRADTIAELFSLIDNV